MNVSVFIAVFDTVSEPESVNRANFHLPDVKRQFKEMLIWKKMINNTASNKKGSRNG